MNWTDIKRLDSDNENVSKYVFETKTAVAESVLYKYPTFEERTVVCCSTQSGCPVGCRFCGAGDNFARSLTAEEIISQPAHLFKDRNIDPDKVEKMQIMFMSMGEPLLNLTALEKAIVKLHESYPKAALLISTTGPRINYERVRAFSKEVPTVGLQFSVHEASDAERNKLIPFENKLTLVEIAKEGRRWSEATGRQPFFNYCVHNNNNSDFNADQLHELFDPKIWQATISVVCERDEHVSAANERQRELANSFQSKLLERGFSTRMFDPAGQDSIGAGCGQLWMTQKWMKNNPNLVRPSKGHGLPVIHTPRL